MKSTSPRWKQVQQSRYPWEREAQDFVREGLPDADPYRVWANVEFVALDGSMNEVDLLVLGPSGFFLVEIKSRPGRLAGDMTTWTWRFEKRDFTTDNPLFLTNTKAKRMKELLLRQHQVIPRDFPFIAPAVFVSAPDLAVQLTDDARTHVFGRDATNGRDAMDAKDGLSTCGLPGILSILTSLPAARGFQRPPVDASLARALTRAVDGAGIRPTQKSRRVGDYVLEKLLFDGNLFQEWQGVHRSMPDLRRRIRIYQASPASGIPRETVVRAAKRELDLLKSADHPGILRVLDYAEHELGPALLFSLGGLALSSVVDAVPETLQVLVKRKLGTGSTAMAFLVERDRRELVLKLALTPEHRSRLEAEAEVLSQLSHPGIVGFHGKVEMYGRLVPRAEGDSPPATSSLLTTWGSPRAGRTGRRPPPRPLRLLALPVLTPNQWARIPAAWIEHANHGN